MVTCRLVFPCFLHVASVYLLLIYPRFSQAASVYLVFVFPRFSPAACVHLVFVVPRLMQVALNTWLFQARKSRFKQSGYRIYLNKRLPRISAAFETKFLGAAVPMRRLFEECRMIPYSRNSVKSKTTLEMSFLQKRVVVEGGVRSELSEDTTEKCWNRWMVTMKRRFYYWP